MASTTPGLQICPHNCGCNDMLDSAATVSPDSEWLAARCPVYEKTDSEGMKQHLVASIHPNCKSTCPAHDSVDVDGRELTPQEYEAWVPFIGHIPQFSQHIPAQYQKLVTPGGLGISYLPHHPLWPPLQLPATIPLRYDDFFAALKGPASNSDSDANSNQDYSTPRVALASVQRDTTTKFITYDGFFGSFSSGVRQRAAQQQHQGDSGPMPSSSKKIIEPHVAPQSRFSVVLPPPDSSPLAPSFSKFAVQLPGIPPRHKHIPPPRPITIAPKPIAPRPAPVPQSSRSAPSDSASTPIAITNNNTTANSNPNPASTASHPASLPSPPRDPATFHRILTSTNPEAIRAAVSAAYTALPLNAQSVFWSQLCNTGTAEEGMVTVVPRYQTCRHCGEVYDTAMREGEEGGCVWHYGTATLDPTAWPPPPPPSTSAPPAAQQHLYFWNCCGARLSSGMTGCVRTTHAPIVPPGAPALKMSVVHMEPVQPGASSSSTAAPGTAATSNSAGTSVVAGKKRKRGGGKGPAVRCVHCGEEYRESDYENGGVEANEKGGRGKGKGKAQGKAKDKEKGRNCAWHDGAKEATGRWSCCGQIDVGGGAGAKTGCVSSRHLPPWVLAPKG
ncbi:hypothetical protein R3P38DRAFT_2891971 [Favolaschia claudopus]|uniref:Uncharacterized protein n=1 Tax=Favolaschia claudopus TaxID=2862362 RepID=A0AAW0CW47_9AGAR